MTRRRVVIADANVLINLLHVGRLDLCGAIPGFEFVVPENVQQEVSRPEHRSALEQAVQAGNLRIETVTGRRAAVQGELRLVPRADLRRECGIWRPPRTGRGVPSPAP